MADQWEMCSINSSFIEIWLPEKYEYLDNNKFLKRSLGVVDGGGSQQKAICILLSDGWEPFATDNSGRCLFRRKHQG